MHKKYPITRNGETMNLFEIKRDLNKSALALLLYVLSVQILAVLLVLLLPLSGIPLLSNQYICMVISVAISYCLLNNIFPAEKRLMSREKEIGGSEMQDNPSESPQDQLGREALTKKEAFSLLAFLHYFMIFQAGQWIGGIINMPIISLFSKLGLNLSFSQEAARGGSLTDFPMLFYTILVAPTENTSQPFGPPFSLL